MQEKNLTMQELENQMEAYIQKMGAELENELFFRRSMQNMNKDIISV